MTLAHILLKLRNGCPSNPWDFRETKFTNVIDCHVYLLDKHQKKPSWQFKVVPNSQREIVGPYEWILDDYTPLFKFKFYVDEITSPQPKTIASLANLHTGDGSHYLTT